MIFRKIVFPANCAIKMLFRAIKIFLLGLVLIFGSCLEDKGDYERSIEVCILDGLWTFDQGSKSDDETLKNIGLLKAYFCFAEEK